MWQKYKWVLLLSAGLVALYFALFTFSTSGYGYVGHDGYDDGPSFLYWSGTGHYYPSQSVRTGSAGGPSARGGGFAGGK